METQSNDDANTITAIKELRQTLETRLRSRHNDHHHLLSSLHTLIPDLFSSLNLSLQLLSTFNRRPFNPLNPNPNGGIVTTPRSLHVKKHALEKSKVPPLKRSCKAEEERGLRSGVEVVKGLVAACLVERGKEGGVFSPIDSSTVSRKIENDVRVTPAEKAALLEVGGEFGAIHAVEKALRWLAEENGGGVELEEFVVSGKSRVMVMNVDRGKIGRGFVEGSEAVAEVVKGGGGGGGREEGNGLGFGAMPRPGVPEMWSIGPGHGDPHMQGMGPMFGGPMMGPRGGVGGGGPRGMGMIGMPRGMGVPGQHRVPFGPNGGAMSGGGGGKQTSDEDVMKDLEALLNKKSFKELEKSKTGEELQDLLHRPTHKETQEAAKVIQPFLLLMMLYV